MLNIDKKIVTKKAHWVKEKNYPQVEMRTQHSSTQMLIIVSPKGAEVKDYECRRGHRWNNPTEGFHVRLSANAAMHMTIEEFDQLHKEVHAAYQEVKDEYTIRGL